MLSQQAKKYILWLFTIIFIFNLIKLIFDGGEASRIFGYLFVNVAILGWVLYWYRKSLNWTFYTRTTYYTKPHEPKTI